MSGARPRDRSRPPLVGLPRRIVRRLGPGLGRRTAPLLALAAALLLATSLVPLRGLWLLHTGHGVDMQSRWQEVHYFLRGIDPNVYGLTSSQSATSDAPFVVFDDLATPGRAFPVGVYPPWSYPLTAPLHLPGSLGAATAWFVALNAAALAALVLWAGARGWRAGGAGASGPAGAAGTATGEPGIGAVPAVIAATLAALSLLALGGLTRTLVVGNYGVVVLLLLVGSLLAIERARPVLAGLLFGAALLKPTLSGPFVIALAAIAWRRHPRDAARLVASASAVVALASLVAWHATGVDPLASTLAAQSHLDSYATEGGGSALLWERLLPPLEGVGEGGRSLRLDQYLGMLLALAVGLALASLARHASALEQFGLASAIALTWSYHRPYDSLLLIFLLLALLERACLHRSAAAALAAALLGATLWTPTRHLGWPDSTPLLQGVWLAAALLLAVSIRRDGARR